VGVGRATSRAIYPQLTQATPMTTHKPRRTTSTRLSVSMSRTLRNPLAIGDFSPKLLQHSRQIGTGPPFVAGQQIGKRFLNRAPFDVAPMNVSSILRLSGSVASRQPRHCGEKDVNGHPRRRKRLRGKRPLSARPAASVANWARSRCSSSMRARCHRPLNRAQCRRCSLRFFMRVCATSS
jgi:hypothetical protein